MKKNFRYWLPVLLWASLIFYVSSIPGEDMPGLLSGQDIILHILEFLVLSLLLSYAIKKSKFKNFEKNKAIILVILFCIIYAASDELHQFFVPGRICSVSDFIADSIGVVIGGFLYPWQR